MSVPVYIISLASAMQRRAFQEEQAQHMGFEPIWHPAMGVNDFSDEIFLQQAFNWQRPLKKTEVGCFLSHLQLWQRIAKSNGPAVVLEDDVLLSSGWYQEVETLMQAERVDYICLETWGKKNLGKTIQVGNLIIQKLHLNSAGAAGYMLWPSGAQILINNYQKKGAALADAFINEIREWSAWQLVPANVVQMMVASEFELIPPVQPDSMIAREQTATPFVLSMWDFWKIKSRRLKGEMFKGWIRLISLFCATRRRVPYKN